MFSHRPLRAALAGTAGLVLTLLGAVPVSAADSNGAAHAPSKAPPPAVDGRTPRAATPANDPQFFYGTAYQYGQSDGAWGFYTVTRPALAAADSHSLAELAVQSADGQQIVEVGYTVDRSLNGDLNPHLFVFHWVNRIPSCYNGCGFVQFSASVRPGAALDVGSTHQLTIRHFAGNWWIGDNDTWVGYYPDSLWGGTYTKAGLVQWFGEVAAFTSTPCSDMGNGQFSSSSTAAIINGIGYWFGPSLSLSVVQPTPGFYTATVFGGNRVRYGGPGAC